MKQSICLTYGRATEYLSPAHFADPIHGRIFQAIGRRIEAGQPADAVTLKTECEHSGARAEVGGTAYLVWRSCCRRQSAPATWTAIFAPSVKPGGSRVD
jgi:hypothetical protein